MQGVTKSPAKSAGETESRSGDHGGPLWCRECPTLRLQAQIPKSRIVMKFSAVSVDLERFVSKLLGASTWMRKKNFSFGCKRKTKTEIRASEDNGGKEWTGMMFRSSCHFFGKGRRCRNSKPRPRARKDGTRMPRTREPCQACGQLQVPPYRTVLACFIPASMPRTRTRGRTTYTET